MSSLDMFPDSFIRFRIEHHGCPLRDHDPNDPNTCLVAKREAEKE